jgi:DNA-binding response OmpR family regulator
MAELLVISDDEGTKCLVQSILQQAGHRVTIASSPREATWMLPSSVEAILISVTPHPQNSVNTMAAIRSDFPDTPLLALVAPDDRTDFFVIRMQGADDVLRYPVTPTRLLQAVRGLLYKS